MTKMQLSLSLQTMKTSRFESTITNSKAVKPNQSQHTWRLPETNWLTCNDSRAGSKSITSSLVINDHECMTILDPVAPWILGPATSTGPASSPAIVYEIDLCCSQIESGQAASQDTDFATPPLGGEHPVRWHDVFAKQPLLDNQLTVQMSSIQVDSYQLIMQNQYRAWTREGSEERPKRYTFSSSYQCMSIITRFKKKALNNWIKGQGRITGSIFRSVKLSSPESLCIMMIAVQVIQDGALCWKFF